MAKSFNTRRYYRGGDDSIESIVAYVLEQHPPTRNNDRRLHLMVQIEVLKRMRKIDETATAVAFAKAVSLNVLPSAKSTRDWRRRIQNRGLYLPTDHAVAQSRDNRQQAARTASAPMHGRCAACGGASFCPSCDAEAVDVMVENEVAAQLTEIEGDPSGLRLLPDEDGPEEDVLDEAA